MWLPDLADAAWVQDVLSRHADQLGLPDGVAAVDLVDVRLTHPHRPGSPRCRGWATYVVNPRGAAPAQLYLKGFPDAGTSEAAWRQDRAARPSGHREHLAAHDLVVWRFPEDPSLPALPGLLRLRRADVPPPVAELFAQRPDELRASVVRYQPEASATLRVVAGDGCDDGGPAAYVKLLADGSVAGVAARHEALWRRTGPGEPLRVAQPLASDPVRRLLWTRGVPGRPLTAAVAPDELPEAGSATGALLAALHRSAIEGMPTVSVADLLDEMRKKAAKIAAAHPAVDAAVNRLVATATRRSSDVASERRCTLHGDFHLDQLVTSEEGPVLVDLDSMVTGPPEVDLGEFLVDLALRGLSPRVADAVSHRLLSSYAAVGGTVVDRALLDVCAAAEFLNRCYRQLRRHTPGWERDLEEQLGRHREVAELLGR